MKIKRWHWITFQLILMVPYIYSMVTVIDMSRAEPIGGYTDESGRFIQCEAVSPPSKYVKTPSCAEHGSMETNRSGYLMAWGSLLLTASMLWVTSRPGRGLRISRDSNLNVNRWRGP